MGLIAVDDGQRSEQQGSGFDTKFDAIFGFLIGALGFLLLLKYRNTADVSVFETHYTTMVAFIIALVIYVGAIAAIVIQNLANEMSFLAVFLKRTAIISGITASSLLVLVLVPPFGMLMLVFDLLLSLFIVFKIKRLRDWTRMTSESGYHHILPKLFFKSRTISSHRMEQPEVEMQVLPV